MTVKLRHRDQWIFRLTPAALRLKIEATRRWLQTDGEPWPGAWDGVRYQLAVMEQRLTEFEAGGS